MTQGQTIVSNPFTEKLIKIKAAQLCKRSDFSKSDFEDLYQEMYMYVWKKSHMFNPEAGTIEAFVTNLVNTWIAMHFRYRNTQKRAGQQRLHSLDVVFENCENEHANSQCEPGEDARLRHIHVYPLSQEFLFELKQDVQTLLEKMTPSDQELLLSLAEYGRNQTCQKFNVTKHAISKLLDRAKELFCKSGVSLENFGQL